MRRHLVVGVERAADDASAETPDAVRQSRADLPVGVAGTREADTVHDALSVAVRCHSDGTSPEVTAQLLVSRGHGPIESIRAIRDAFGVSLGHAKALVHPNLSTDQQEAAERLWDAAEAALHRDC